MAKSLRRVFHTAAGEVITGVRPSPDRAYRDRHGRILVSVQPSRLEGIRKLLLVGGRFLCGDGKLLLNGSKDFFSSSDEPRPGDCLAVVRQTDCKILGVTAPLTKPPGTVAPGKKRRIRS